MIYAVMRIKIESAEKYSYYVYSKTTSNKSKLEEYAEILRKTYPNHKIIVLPKEEVERIVKIEREQRKTANTPKIDCITLYKHSQKILDKQGICKAFWRK